MVKRQFRVSYMTFSIAAFAAMVSCSDDAAPPADLNAVDEQLEAEPAAGADGENKNAEAEPEVAKKPARRFMQVEGDVKIDGTAAAVDTEIPETCKIVTGAGGHAVITLQPGNIVEIRENSEVNVGTSARKKISLQLLSGILWNFLPKGASYEVEVPNAVAGVRGTVFYVEARSKKESYICTCDGDVEIVTSNKKSFNKVVKSDNAHKAFTFKTKGKRQKAKKGKRLNHDDPALEKLIPFLEAAQAEAEEQEAEAEATPEATKEAE